LPVEAGRHPGVAAIEKPAVLLRVVLAFGSTLGLAAPSFRFLQSLLFNLKEFWMIPVGGG
jgi:hypothetical protein